MLPEACTPTVPTETRDRTVADLLAHSRAAHLRKKHCAGRATPKGDISSPPNYPAAEQAIREAIRDREQAHQLDPDKTDPAWVTDQALNKGVHSEALLVWMREYLLLP